MWTAPLLVLAVAAAGALMGWLRWRRAVVEQTLLRESQVIWDFSINADLCIGCDKCVKVCPRDVLELEPQTQVAQVARRDDCIQCRACDKACPTQALRMYERGGPDPRINMPDLDEHYQPKGIHGLYLIGQSAGKPRIKNAINLGQAAVEHMVVSGLQTQSGTTMPSHPAENGATQAPSPANSRVDVAIVGAGPGGLAAAVACTQHGLSYVLLDQEPFPLSTIVRYPKGKLVHSLPHELQCISPLAFEDCTKEELVAKWQDVKATFQIREEAEVVVTDVQKRGAAFELITDRRGTYRAQRVIIAIGGRGLPKLLPKVSEAQQNVSFVHKLLDNPEAVCGQKILVAGGGDAAVEAALALSRPNLGNSVFLIYYKNKKFLGANKENLHKLELAEQMQEVVILDQAEPISIVLGIVTYERKKKVRELPIDKVYVLIGSNPNNQFLKKIGVATESFDHASFSRGATDKLVSGLLEAQRKKGIVPRVGGSKAPIPPTAPVGVKPPPLPKSIWDTTVVPGQEDQIFRRHEELAAVRAQPANTDRLTASSPDLQDGAVSSERDSPDSVWGTRWEPNRGDVVASLHAQTSGTTERLTPSQPGQGTSTAGAQAPLPAPSPVAVRKSDVLPNSASVLKADSAVFRTIRIPKDQYLMRMPAKAEAPKDARTVAEREAVIRTTERKVKQ